MRMKFALQARLIAETDEVTAVAQAQIAQLLETLANYSNGSPAQFRALSELQAIKDKLSRLQTLSNLVRMLACDPTPASPGRMHRTLLH